MKNIATLQKRGQTIQSQLHQQTFIQAILMSVTQHTKKNSIFMYIQANFFKQPPL